MSEQQPVEMILLRQAASYLTIPVWMMDREGNLLYYNEPAERLLGMTFDDAGPVHADQLATLFDVTDPDGTRLPDIELPVVTALVKQHPAHRIVRFRGLDEVWRTVEISAMPVVGQGGRFLGVFATFWETGD